MLTGCQLFLNRVGWRTRALKHAEKNYIKM